MIVCLYSFITQPAAKLEVQAEEVHEQETEGCKTGEQGDPVSSQPELQKTTAALAEDKKKYILSALFLD